MKKRIYSLVLIICLLFTSCADKTQKVERQEEKRVMDNACKTTYGKYPRLIKYTLGKMTGVNNSNMPEGDTYENNAYTRYLREKLNVQNEDAFEVEENGNYNETVSMAISSNNIPDVMQVTDYSTLQMLVENNMIEDLTQVYKDCAGDRVKKIYESYGKEFLDKVTFNGKLMALPGTNIENGPGLLWLRKDWLDRLHLKEPETIDDVCRIVKKFIEKGIGGIGETVGLVCSDEISGGSGVSEQYRMDTVFSAYEAYPKKWIRGKSGKVVYGSVEPQMKKALEKLRIMYKQGIIDKDFMLREDSNIVDLIIEGKCGAFFGPWWSSNNPLMAARQRNPQAEWMPYLIKDSKNGVVNYSTQNQVSYYIVVRKGYKHPEIVPKIVSLLFDDYKYGKDEIAKYYQLNVDPTARPFAINIDYNNSLEECYKAVKNTYAGKTSVMDLSLFENACYKSCKRYKDNNNPTIEDWAVYTSRITACSLIVKAKKNKVKSLFYGETISMSDDWWKLQEFEKEAFLSIVTGDRPLDYFDKFVEEWYSKGGNGITKEVRQNLKNKQN